MVAQFASLAEAHGTRVALERLLPSVSILMFFLVLRQTEGFGAESTLYLFLRVVLLVVPLQRKFCLEGGITEMYVTFKDGKLRHFFDRLALVAIEIVSVPLHQL